ncbi:hypothetical protein SPHINGOT1_10081 [Sphingomonas sp. T1]|nr:hypothetical protein SPHINGOT1_10081 [Sphingomonas sp. T1]
MRVVPGYSTPFAEGPSRTRPLWLHGAPPHTQDRQLSWISASASLSTTSYCIRGNRTCCQARRTRGPR